MKDYLKEKGYIKSGKIYTPPIFKLGKFTGINWIDELVPELFWIGILQKEYGFGNGSNLASTICEISLHHAKNKNTWFAPVSSFNNLTGEEKKNIKNELISKHFLSQIQNPFKTIIHYYPKFPLSFLFDGYNCKVSKNELEMFKSLLENILDRTSVSANLIQGVALDFIFRTNIKLRISPNISLAQFPKFQEYPTTDISKKVASSIRAVINQLYLEFHKPNSDETWKKYFWDMGLQIDSCK